MVCVRMVSGICQVWVGDVYEVWVDGGVWFWAGTVCRMWAVGIYGLWVVVYVQCGLWLVTKSSTQDFGRNLAELYQEVNTSQYLVLFHFRKKIFLGSLCLLIIE